LVSSTDGQCPLIGVKDLWPFHPEHEVIPLTAERYVIWNCSMKD